MEENKEHPEYSEHLEHPEHHPKKHKKTNVWMIATIVFAALLIVVLFTGFNLTGMVTKGYAEKNFVAFADNLGLDVKVNDMTSFGSNLYLANVSINGENGILYITKDGKYVSSSVSPMIVPKDTANSQTEQPSTEVVKSDKPLVELFIMTHCPYGTQAEKGFIPAIKNLGSTIDAKVRFVHYFMHGDVEEKETYNQVCIREEQSAKYLDYLSCFLEDGNTTRCLKKVNVEQKKLDSCLANDATKAKGYYAIDSELSNSYGVQGSPTLVINGVQVSASRDSASILDAICSTFNNAPESCGASLSSTSPSPGFGTGTASSDSAAQCA